MPRKKWVPKNPYCRNSRLDERCFERLVDCYLNEVFDYPRYYSYLLFNVLAITEDRSEVEKIIRKELMLSEDAPYPEFKNAIITLRSFNKYFERIGDHLWNAYVDSRSALFNKRETAFDELLDLIYEKTDKISGSAELFSFIGNSLEVNRENIQKTLMFYLLSQRSKIIRGFIKEKFYLEFIRIYYICRITESIKLELKSIYSIVWPPNSYTKNYPDDVEIVRIQTEARHTLLEYLKGHPM